MYPTRVPTYSTEIGTSRSTTGSTFTTAAGGDAVARDESPHPAAGIIASPISETTSSPRMSIMRLLLSSGAEGKRIHTVRPSAGGPAHEARTIHDIVACPSWTRSDATLPACTALPTSSASSVLSATRTEYTTGKL